MGPWSQKISFWLRGCSVCRLSVPPQKWLCLDCRKLLKKWYLPPSDMVRCQNGLIHLRLLDWNQKNNSFLRIFLNSLKKGGPDFIFKELMEDFFERAVQVLPSKSLFSTSKKIIVPAPPKKFFLKDHAVCLSQALSQLSGIPFDHLLHLSGLSLRRQSMAQKIKNKNKRKTINFKLRKLLPQFIEEVIFMDDILTTGSTACAAHKVLSPFGRFKIFTLAWREKKPSHCKENMLSL